MSIVKLSSAILIAGSFACGQAGTTAEETETAERTSLAPEEAALAEQYAPAAYHEGQVALERALDRAEDNNRPNLEEAHFRFREALTQADAMRAEAMRTADDNIEEASLLVELVRMIRANDNRTAESPPLPSAAALQEASDLLTAARAAFERGDFVEAGLSASNVIQLLGQPAAT